MTWYHFCLAIQRVQTATKYFKPKLRSGSNLNFAENIKVGGIVKNEKITQGCNDLKRGIADPKMEDSLREFEQIFCLFCYRLVLKCPCIRLC